MNVLLGHALVRSILFLALLAMLSFERSAFGQAAGVPIYKQGRKESEQDDNIAKVARELYAAGQAVKLEEVKRQLKRGVCELALPAIHNNRLGTRELCVQARQSHVRVGWCYLCGKCDDWHVNLAGGYAITTNGAIATCYHVVQPSSDIKQGCLVGADEEGNVFPIAEVLAANLYSDACIVRITGGPFSPLPLNTNAYPGDLAFCYSDPLEHRGYFSSGVVNRFYQFPGRRAFSAPESAAYAPTRLNVTTDWAPGSSGSAVLDEYGNAIGHVSTISGLEEEDDVAREKKRPPSRGALMIVFHEAVSARDVLLLIKPCEK